MVGLMTAIASAPPAPPLRAWAYGLIAVVMFSGSLPATRAAVHDLAPLFVTMGRAAIAGLIGGALLVILRQPRPRRSDLPSLAITAAGVVFGFPLFTGLALAHITAAHASVYIGLLPLSTAIFAVWRGGERPRPAFWVFAAFGSACVAGFALHASATASWAGDGAMIVAITACGLGYAEGARLSRSLGGWQVVCWALVISLPVTLTYMLAGWPDWAMIGGPAKIGFAYVSLFAMLIGFFFWYRGLAEGGIAAIGQLQLLQPFLGLAIAAALLGEHVGWDMAIASAGVIASVAASRRWGR
jgi:drug/metabolite transporter (DMT)-like permease